MFNKIKGWFQQDRIIQNCSTLEIFQENNDPRELPRPNKYIPKNHTASSIIFADKTSAKTGRIKCNCKNCCEILDNFSECVVCMEPLQSAAISSCMFCGNYTCWGCGDKVSHCPFCRANFHPNENRTRNFALERILLKLELPCKHARWGCQMQLNHKDRPSHENSCEFAPAGCPLVKLCGWHGDEKNIVRHLKDSHDMTLIAANGINIEIENFRTKLLNTNIIPRLYTVSLACYGNIYMCKLKLVKQKLRLIFFQITGDEVVENDIKFAAWLEISSVSRSLRGTVEISPKFRNNKEVIIPGPALISAAAKQNDEQLKISITIKPV